MGSFRRHPGIIALALLAGFLVSVAASADVDCDAQIASIRSDFHQKVPKVPEDPCTSAYQSSYNFNGQCAVSRGMPDDVMDQQDACASAYTQMMCARDKYLNSFRDACQRQVTETGDCNNNSNGQADAQNCAANAAKKAATAERSAAAQLQQNMEQIGESGKFAQQQRDRYAGDQAAFRSSANAAAQQPELGLGSAITDETIKSEAAWAGAPSVGAYRAELPQLMDEKTNLVDSTKAFSSLASSQVTERDAAVTALNGITSASQSRASNSGSAADDVNNSLKAGTAVAGAATSMARASLSGAGGQLSSTAASSMGPAGPINGSSNSTPGTSPLHGAAGSGAVGPVSQPTSAVPVRVGAVAGNGFGSPSNDPFGMPVEGLPSGASRTSAGKAAFNTGRSIGADQDSKIPERDLASSSGVCTGADCEAAAKSPAGPSPYVGSGQLGISKPELAVAQSIEQLLGLDGKPAIPTAMSAQEKALQGLLGDGGDDTDADRIRALKRPRGELGAEAVLDKESESLFLRVHTRLARSQKKGLVQRLRKEI